MRVDASYVPRLPQNVREVIVVKTSPMNTNNVF